ncbi:uncharacterized protein FIBRA_03637 [Fibroporia radiculosa]|uniref:STB6-like N-terminal domain-containing protein n=1 Tax=Fibroporia radiculosa TaxID=599839 RepID=J4HW36_9APHY|nr:uncharacterized protein FIBRA_03637 [Fibroporia radiculosa]CCM01577.1 predicted protein [Fibroporia radiculosa]
MKPSDRSTSRLTIPSPSYVPQAGSRSRNGFASASGYLSSPSASPLVARSYSQLSSPLSPSPRSQPPTPLEMPREFVENTPEASTKRLLMPTVRAVRNPSSPRISQYRSSPSKIPRSRAGSVSNPMLVDLTDRAAPPGCPADWIGGGCKFDVVEDLVELEGYQIYAVEKWVVERRRPVIVLTVFTGDSKHKITVTAFSPSPSSPEEAQSEWDIAMRTLRSDGARPKEVGPLDASLRYNVTEAHCASQTGKGVLMVTSLANFRSDYTIVHIPRGNFLEVREQLYTNINLLRMGCSGRSALTLEEPSDTTKDRFVLMYHVPDKAVVRSGGSFNATVLELVKLIQAALAIFDMFDLVPEERNGLLCDVTSEGIKRWVTDVGEPCMKVEHMERVADPTLVAALLSLIMTIRNKLHALGHYVPKDPFLDPQGFTRALAACQMAKPHGPNLALTPSPRASSPPARNPSPNPTSTIPSSNPSPLPPTVYLSHQFVESIQSAYEKKTRQTEPYKVHRVLINKLDDLASDLRTGTSTGSDAEGGGSAAASVLNPTADLGAFVRVVVGNSRDAPHSLRYLWTGRLEETDKKRREKEALWSDTERDREERDRERDGEKDGRGRDIWDKGWREKGKDRDELSREREVRSSGDESESLKPWSGRVQRKIESWAALGRGKKLSVDFGALGKTLLDSPHRGGHSEQSGPSSTVPSVRISGDPDEDDGVLSSGQVSPIYESSTPMMLGIGSWTSAHRSTSELSDYDRRVIEFNKKRPSMRPYYQSRIVSWSDPLSAKEIVDKSDSMDDMDTPRVPNATTYARKDDDFFSEIEVGGYMRRQDATFGRPRSRSFEAPARLKDLRVLPAEWMRIDVELCGQLLILHRREEHLKNVVACLSALADRVSHTNTKLRTDHEAARPALEGLREQAHILQRVEMARARTDALTQETQALAYESAQYLVEDLWHMAVQPRRRVIALREQVFSTGRRISPLSRGARGRFSRVQWTLDGRERLVDALGRTESEAEEEEWLPFAASVDDDSDTEEVDEAEHKSLRPTWLLRFFNYWGTKWGALRDPGKGELLAKDNCEAERSREDTPERGFSTSLPESPPIAARIRQSGKDAHTTMS